MTDVLRENCSDADLESALHCMQWDSGEGFFKEKSPFNDLTGRDDNDYFIRKRSLQKACRKWIAPGVDNCFLCDILRTVLDKDSEQLNDWIKGMPVSYRELRIG